MTFKVTLYWGRVACVFVSYTNGLDVCVGRLKRRLRTCCVLEILLSSVLANSQIGLFFFLYICIRSCSVRLRAVSLFSWSVEQNSRDTQMTTRVTEGVRALPILNLKKKRETAPSLVFCSPKMLSLILFCTLFDLFSKQWKFNCDTFFVSLHVTEVCSDLYLTL